MNVFFMVKRNSPLLSKTFKIHSYKSIILPKLLYGSECWFANVSNIRRLENVQKKVLKWAAGSDDHIHNLVECNLLPLSLYMQLKDLLLFSKLMNGYYDCDIEEFLHFRAQSRELRSSDKISFQHDRPSKKLCDQGFVTRTCALINKLPKSISYGNSEGLKSRLRHLFWDIFSQSSTK